MSLRGFWAAVCLGAACAAVSAACSSGSSHGTSGGDGGAEDASTSDVSTADGPSSGDASDGSPSTGDGGDAGENLDSGINRDSGDCGIGPSGEATQLSCAGLYSDWASKTVAPGLVQYAPGLQLWSDGAIKTRWIELPAGQTIDTSNMDEWTFPVGTKFWKEFRLPSGDGGTVRIETRLIWKQGPGNWYDTTYRWSDDGESSATELTAGELDANGAGYEVPSRYECLDCHQGRLDNVMGFEAVGLSVPGTTGITLVDLIEAGTLTVPPAGPFTIPGNPVEVAALGWLHVNCGEACHNTSSGAEANGSGLLTRLDVATLTSVQTTDTYITAWNQTAGGFTIPGANTTYLLHACDVAESAVYYRPSVRNGVDGIGPGNQMPPIDTHRVDDAGLSILSAWINEGCDGGDGG